VLLDSSSLTTNVVSITGSVRRAEAKGMITLNRSSLLGIKCSAGEGPFDAIIEGRFDCNRDSRGNINERKKRFLLHTSNHLCQKWCNRFVILKK
jgi:hypothetical protein